MKAMVCRAWGAPDVLRLENVPSRALRPGEVRIRVHAAGVNFADSLMVGGTYQVKPPFPFTPGLEAAGEVIETGSGVMGLRTRQRVLTVLRNGGGYAEEIAGGADKLAVAQSRGADEPIDYRRESIRDRVRELTGGKGADVVYDPVGGDAFDQALRAVNWEARMLVIGFASGRIQAVPANLILVKNISVIGVVWRAQTERDPAWMSRNLVELLRWWCQGKLKPLIAKTFPLAEAGVALNALLSRRYAGKVVLEI